MYLPQVTLHPHPLSTSNSALSHLIPGANQSLTTNPLVIQDFSMRVAQGIQHPSEVALWNAVVPLGDSRRHLCFRMWTGFLGR